MKINDLFIEKTFQLNREVIDSIPELNALKGCQQNQKYHKEGDAYVHTMMCVDSVYNYITDMQNLDYDDITIKCIITAVLFHDLGKAKTETIKDGIYHSYGHEFASERIVRVLLWDEQIRYREKVCGLVRNHMIPLTILNSKNVVQKLAYYAEGKYFNLTELYFIKKADIDGTVNDYKESDKNDIEIYRHLLMQFGFEAFGILFDEYEDDLYTRYMRKFMFNEDVHRDAPTVWVRFMIGLPGSGKSTCVKNIMKEHPDAVVISRDIVRAELGYCEDGEKCVLDRDKEEEVSKACDAKLIKAVNDGKYIILDNMHTKKKYRDNVKELLKSVFPKTNFKYEYTYCETTLKNCLECRPMISQNVYKNMIEAIDWPMPEEYHLFETVYHV